MSLKILAHLNKRTIEILKFRRILSDSPTHLARAEAVFRCYEIARDRILEEVPKFHELKGLAAGLKLAGPVIAQHQEITKKQIDDAEISKDVGKAMVLVLARAASSLSEAVAERIGEVKIVTGKIDGLYVSATAALEEIESTLRHFDSVNKEDDENWSGRGTSNGQRDTTSENGCGGAVLELAGKKTRRKAIKKSRAKKPNGSPSKEA